MFSFGPQIRIPTAHVFHATQWSFCCVNLSPVVPGHVLVIAKQPRRRMADMEEAETADLLVAGRYVARVAERVYGATASTYVVQDGTDAGQTVPQVGNARLDFVDCDHPSCPGAPARHAAPAGRL